MKKAFLTTIASLSLSFDVMADNGFAIVIDPTSYKEAKTEVEAYANALKKYNGLKVYTIIDKWQVPDSIRAELKRLYELKSSPISGAVFIGDIPIPMIRDAQHLTSAFKMNQKYDRRESSVPSDRFYDDFDLDFKYLDKDNEKPYYYYSLTAESKQKIFSDIYSGRIRPTDTPESSKYEKLRDYLRKVVKEKERRRELKQMFFFSGQGYISESKIARIDEKNAYFEHFPGLKDRINRISYMDHTDHNPAKEHLMNEMMRSDLDLAILHHHGSPETQYLNGIAPIRTVNEAKDFITKNVRLHLDKGYRRGRNTDSLRVVYEKRFDLPVTWLGDNPLNDSLRIADSTSVANEDLHLEDFKIFGYRPNVPLVFIDACFCGSFHLDNCIANEYLFQPGNTVTVIANTVNALQDKWYDRFIGLTEQGGCAGDVVRFSNLLESHVIGDPTFRYESADGSINLDKLLHENKTSAWKKLLKSNLPDVQAIAIEQLNRKGKISSEELLDIYNESPYGIVRLEALSALATINDSNFIKALEEASQDSYELVQRLAIKFIGKSGDERLIPALIQLAIANNTSDRCNFNVMTALRAFPKEKLVAEFDKQFYNNDVKYMSKDSIGGLIRKTIERSYENEAKELKNILNGTATEKNKNFTIRATRNNMPHYMIPELLDYLTACNDETTQIMMLEAMGWHTISCHAKEIADTALKMSRDNKLSESVRNEALKTYNRMITVNTSNE